MKVFGKSRYVPVYLGVEVLCGVCDRECDEVDAPCKWAGCSGQGYKTDPTQTLHFDRPLGDEQQPMLSLSNELKEGKVIELTRDQLHLMQEHIAQYLKKVDGEDVSMNRKEVNQELSPTEAFGVFMRFIVACQMGEDDREKLRRPSRSPSPKTQPCTTVESVPTGPNGPGVAQTH